MANINVVLALSALVTTFVALIFTIVALSTEYWLVTDISSMYIHVFCTSVYKSHENSNNCDGSQNILWHIKK